MNNTEQLFLKIKFLIIGLILGALAGMLFERSTIDQTSKVEYEKGETITSSVDKESFVPVKEERTSVQYRDTGSIKYIPVDTAAIIADYELKRTYKVTAFDNDKQGKLELFPVVQFNKLTDLDYKFTPIYQKQTIYKERILQPFISTSYSTLNYMSVGGGVFYHNLGFEYQYQQSLNGEKNGHLIGAKYRF